MRFLITALLTISVLPATSFAQPYNKGDTVVVSTKQAPIKVNNKIVEQIDPGFIFTVTDVDSDSLEVRHTRRGWINKEDVVPLDQAYGYFNRLVEQHPEDVEWQIARAMISDADTRIAEITSLLKQPLRKVNTQSLYIARGNAWSMKQEYEMAIANFSKAIRLDSSKAPAYNNRGNAWNSLGNYDKAIIDYSAALENDPENSVVYFNRGSLWLFKEEHDKAMFDFDMAIRLDPKNALAYYTRGHTWKNKQDIDQAIADYTEAILIDPNLAMAYYSRGNAWGDKQDYDKAIADLTRVLLIDPGYVMAFLDRGVLWNAKGETDLAIEDFSETIRLAPNFPLAYTNRAIAWRDLKQYANAIEDFSQVIRLEPNNGEAYNNRGWASLKHGLYDEAESDFTRALQINANDSWAHSCLAWLLSTCPDADVRDGARAVKHGESACQLTNYENPYYFDTLAAAYAETGQFDKAVEWQRKLGDLYNGEAKVEWQEILDHYERGQPYRIEATTH